MALRSKAATNIARRRPVLARSRDRSSAARCRRLSHQLRRHSTFPVIEDIEQKLGRPVMTRNEVVLGGADASWRARSEQLPRPPVQFLACRSPCTPCACMMGRLLVLALLLFATVPARPAKTWRAFIRASNSLHRRFGARQKLRLVARAVARHMPITFRAIRLLSSKPADRRRHRDDQ